MLCRGLAKVRGQQDGSGGKGSCHEKAGRKAACPFGKNAGDGGAGDLAKPEDEGDEPECGEGFFRPYVLAHGGDHDGWDRPGHDAVAEDGQIEEKRW